MKDPISFPRASLLHPAIRQEVIQTINLIEACFPESIRVRIVEGLRTVETQNIYFAKGRTTPGPRVTNARGGSSYHNFGLAFDFALIYDRNGDRQFKELSWDINYDFDKDGKKDWMEVVAPFIAAGFTWGGNFKSITDSPHFEKTFGYNWRDLLGKYNSGDFIPGSKYVRL